MDINRCFFKLVADAFPPLHCVNTQTCKLQKRLLLSVRTFAVKSVRNENVVKSRTQQV